jgi:type II pantothenate kinase
MRIEKPREVFIMSKRVIVGIDVGGSTTKIVGFDENKKLINPLFVRATDQITSIYGAFGKFTSENSIELSEIDRVMMTGVGSSFIEKPIYGLKCERVPEFECVGRGGLYLSGFDQTIVVSLGTGTALVYAKGKNEVQYLGGTGVGGGTLIGLSKKMIGVDTIEHLEALCEGGDLDNVDLRIKDISADNNFQINEELTASNFGKLSDMATKNDLALGIANLVAETIMMLGVFAARNYGLKNIILTGNLTAIKPIRTTFEGLKKSFDVDFIIPDNAQFGTVIGAALFDEYRSE